MAILKKAQILEVQDIATQEVAVPEWGGSVIIKCMTGAERNQYEQSILIRSGDNFQANLSLAKEKLLVMTLVDEDGKRLFGDGDLKALAEKNAAVIDRLFTASSRLSGITEADVDELAKNSEATQNGDFGSG